MDHRERFDIDNFDSVSVEDEPPEVKEGRLDARDLEVVQRYVVLNNRRSSTAGRADGRRRAVARIKADHPLSDKLPTIEARISVLTRMVGANLLATLVILGLKLSH
jgi:hypothetical protein